MPGNEWIDDTLERAHGVNELQAVAERFLRLQEEERDRTLEELWEFTRTLEGEEQTKFTVMAAILDTASRILRERDSAGGQE